MNPKRPEPASSSSAAPDAESLPGAASLRTIAARLTGVRPEEAGIVLLSAAYFFCVLSAYYVIRPIRETLGVAGGVGDLKWLFTGTLLAMLVAHPIFAALVARLPRRKFVTVAYRFFMGCLVGFWALLWATPEGTDANLWIGRAFFVWTSVFNLFVVSVFWSFMTDIHRERRSRRLFGLIGVGGTLGAILGSSIAATLADQIFPAALLWFSVALLECAVACVRALERRVGGGDGARDREELDPASLASPDAGSPWIVSREHRERRSAPLARRDEGLVAALPARGATQSEAPGTGIVNHGLHIAKQPLHCGQVRKAVQRRCSAARMPWEVCPRAAGEIIGGSPLEGIGRVARSPYLLGICAFMLLFTVGSAFLYNIQAEIVSNAVTTSGGRTLVFARIDLAVNTLTLVTQLLLTGRIIGRFGVGPTLAILPIVSIAGFLALGALPALAVFVAFQVLRRSANFALANPAREVLYTVLPRRDKYKAKNFNDTFVYRAGDQVGAWSFAGLGAVGLGTAAMAWTMVPVAGTWLLVALWLGRRQREMAA